MSTAKAGFESVGVELNFWLVLYSRLIAMKSNIHPTPKFIRTDLWKYHLKPFSNVVIFGVEEMVGNINLIILWLVRFIFPCMFYCFLHGSLRDPNYNNVNHCMYKIFLYKMLLGCETSINSFIAHKLINYYCTM